MKDLSPSADPYWPSFRRGFAVTLPIQVATIPFGLIFGVIAIETGLDLPQIFAMSAIVMAGASSLVALELLADQAPALVVICLSALVNLRMAMYSAALVPHLGKASMGMRMVMSYFMVDQSFAIAARKYEETPGMPLPHKIIYYFACLLPIVPLWYLCSYVGARLGAAIPPEYSLDFAIPSCFIALTAPMMRSLPHFLAALVSIIGALALAWVPYSLGLIIAAVFAMAVGAEVERRLQGDAA